jgi:hypothetical protein
VRSCSFCCASICSRLPFPFDWMQIAKLMMGRPLIIAIATRLFGLSISTHVILSFLIFLFFAPIICCLLVFRQTKFPKLSQPPGSCVLCLCLVSHSQTLTFYFFSLSIFSFPVTLPPSLQLQPACFSACLLFALCVCGLCLLLLVT